MDLEANGLFESATVLHCAVFKDIDSGKMYEFIGWSEELKDFLDKCTCIIAHNGIDFDIPLLNKLHGWKPSDDTEIVDTLTMSRTLDPDRAPVEGTRAPHSVEAWGKRLGRWKPDHEDWSTFSPAMLHRCKEDVEIQHLVYQYLCAEATHTDPSKSIFDKTAYTEHDWSLALWHEHMSAKIITEQKINGCYFDKEKAEEYVETLENLIEDLTITLLENVPPKPKQKGVEIKEPFKKTGELKKAVTDWYPEDPGVSGPFTRVEWETLNLSSDKQLKEWLYTQGWEPDEWNFSKTETDEEGNPVKTSPKITETSLKKLESGVGDLLIKRSKASHRLSQIKGWIGNCRDDHRISADANPQGTPTGRMRHRVVANVPSANVYENKDDKNDPRNGELIWYPEEQKVFFGTEMRSLFCASPEHVLVGRDASGLELRCFAHYLNDPKYTDVILSGDIHSYNQEMAGLETRGQAKTFIYAFLYGAGQAKLGSIVLPDGTEAQKQAAGKEMQERFLAANPKLADLVKNVKKASGRGWLKGLDGRKLNMRTFNGAVQKNKALNTLLQGAGAIIMTRARVWLWEQVQNTPELSSAIKVLDYHDEETYECKPEIAEQLREVMIQSVVESGKFFSLNIPLDADARIGKSWAEIH
jgi:hypothetical protein